MQRKHNEETTKSLSASTILIRYDQNCIADARCELLLLCEGMNGLLGSFDYFALPPRTALPPDGAGFDPPGPLLVVCLLSPSVAFLAGMSDAADFSMSTGFYMQGG
jgi:hypothetical protein